jgi:hypothetical protein
MSCSIVLFSVCRELLFRRNDIIDFLHCSFPDVRVLSIDLDDKLFTMSVRVSTYKAGLIENKLAEKGLRIRLLYIVQEDL